MAARKKHCKVCHARGVNFGPDGRCLGCRVVLAAQAAGVHYGAFVASYHEKRIPLERVEAPEYKTRKRGN